MKYNYSERFYVDPEAVKHGGIPVRGDMYILATFKDGYEETVSDFEENIDKEPFRADFWPEKFWTHETYDDGLRITSYIIVTPVLED